MCPVSRRQAVSTEHCLYLMQSRQHSATPIRHERRRHRSGDSSAIHLLSAPPSLHQTQKQGPTQFRTPRPNLHHIVRHFRTPGEAAAHLVRQHPATHLSQQRTPPTTPNLKAPSRGRRTSIFKQPGCLQLLTQSATIEMFVLTRPSRRGIMNT